MAGKNRNIDEWIKQEQGKHFCKCGCGKEIKIQSQYKSKGIPEYTRGHCPKDFRNTIDDFWKKVDKTSKCWNWTGHVNNKGYGMFYFRGKNSLAHRISYEDHHGKGSCDGFFVNHHCDNPCCLRPSHLFAGDQEANMSDAAKKGRCAHKFDRSVVMRVVELVNGGMNRIEAAKIVGVSQSLATKIMDGSVWSHLTGIPKKKGNRHGR